MRIVSYMRTVAAALVFASAASFSHAEMTEETRSSALKAITDTADKICGSVPTSGDHISLEVKGAISAQLNVLVKKLADLGISGNGDVSSGSYEGLLQQDLPAALADARGCKVHVFDKLQETLLKSDRSDDGLIIITSADIQKDIQPGHPIITTVHFLNTGKEPIELSNLAAPLLLKSEKWADGTARSTFDRYMDSCMDLQYPLGGDNAVRIAYPGVVYNWILPSNDQTLTAQARFLVDENFILGSSVFSFPGCLVYKNLGSSRVRHASFCFFYQANKPGLTLDGLAYCPWGQKVD